MHMGAPCFPMLPQVSAGWASGQNPCVCRFSDMGASIAVGRLTDNKGGVYGSNSLINLRQSGAESSSYFVNKF